MRRSMIDRTLQRLWQVGSDCLARAGFDAARWEARQLIEQVLDLPSGQCLLAPDRVVADADWARVLTAFQARAKGQPLGRIVGQRDFWTLTLSLNADTLEPRPDSEALIRAALEQIEERDYPWQILDLGGGTGCLGLALLSELPQARLLAVDYAMGACQMIWQNARQNELSNRVRVVRGDWAAAIAQKFDIVVSNPPYIALADQDLLAQNVRDFDPPLALFGGADGLDAYRVLLPQLNQLLKSDGFCAIEMGATQKDDVAELARRCGLMPQNVCYDYNNLPRGWILRQIRFL